MFNTTQVVIEVIQNGTVLPTVIHNGQTYVQTPNSGEYEIRLQNLTFSRKKVVLSVDGLNVINGQEAAMGGQGYLLSARETLTVKGFLRNNDECARFTFTEASTSYTAKTGHGTSNTGVIGIAVFDEAKPVRVAPIRYSYGSDQFLGGLSRGGSQDTSFNWNANPGVAAAAGSLSTELNSKSLGSKSLGTGYGRAEAFHTQTVEFKVASATPSSVLTLRYATAETLRSWGVPVPSSPPSPNPFPATHGFAQPPADWRR